MAIRIVADLAADPGATALPGSVGLEQTLQCTGAPEKVSILYMLDGDHNVWFRRDDAALAKSLRFDASIDAAGTRLRHAVTLARGSGEGGTAIVQIDETIETQLGIPLGTAVAVQVL